MIEQYYIDSVNEKSLREVYEMYQRVNQSRFPEHFNFLQNFISSKTSENLSNIPDYSTFSREALLFEKENISENELLKLELIEYELKRKPIIQEKIKGGLAGRAYRLFAIILDAIILMVPALLIISFTIGISEYENLVNKSFLNKVYNFILTSIYYLLVNGYLLYKNGQSIGKKILNIQIVDLEGKVPSIFNTYVYRILLVSVIAQLPFVGILFSLVDSLFIFRKDRRCLHDHIAGTKVTEV